MLKIAIVDDEQSSIQLLQAYLMRFAAEKGFALETASFKDGLELLKGYCPKKFDIILLDIEMAHVNGLKTAEEIRTVDENTILIFVTQMAQYAVQSYRVEALDYMLKPVDYFSFELVMRKAIKRLSKHEGRELALTLKDEVKIISVADLYYIEVLDHYLTYHTVQGNITAKGTLGDIESVLGTECFFRCNRCYLVNLRHVRTVKKDSIVVGNQEIGVSRAKKKELMKAIMTFLGGSI